MIRKSLIIMTTLATLALIPLCHAQSQEPSISSVIEVARADMRADRDTIITATMNLNDKDGAAFWPIYRKYQYERSMVEDGRAAVVKEYAEKYSSINDTDAKAMTERMLDNESREIALKKKYFKEFSKVLPAVTVAKFFQLDHRIDLVMDTKVESSLPPLTGLQNAPTPASQQDAAKDDKGK
jgi:hypothetical protein